MTRELVALIFMSWVAISIIATPFVGSCLARWANAYPSPETIRKAG